MTQRVLSLPRRKPPVVLRTLPSGRALLLATAGLLIAAGLYGLARETSMFAVRSVEVEGAPPALAAHVREALQSLQGRSLLAVNGGEVVSRVENLPSVQ